MGKKERILETALAVATRSVDALWDDVTDNKLTLEQIRQKHNERIEMALETIEKASKLPDIDIFIHINEDNEIENVYSKRMTRDYVVLRDGYVFDSHDVKETDPFEDYEDLLAVIMPDI